MPRRSSTTNQVRFYAAALIILVASADTGVQTLRESALRSDFARQIDASFDASEGDAVVSKAVRSVEQAQRAVQNAVRGSVRHNRFTEVQAAGAADSKALVDGSADAGEPFSAGIIIIATIASMVMKVLAAAEKARLAMKQEKWNANMQLLLDSTAEDIRAMTKYYEEVFGEVTRQIGDLVREMGVATVQLVQDDNAIIDAAKTAVARHDKAKLSAPPSSNTAESELHNRFIQSPAIIELKNAKTTQELRKALAKVVASDYALIHSSGDIRGKAKFSDKLEQYVYAVEPKAMKKLFKLALSSSPVLTPMLPEEITIEAAMRRMSDTAMMRTYASSSGSTSDTVLAAQRDANKVLLTSQGSMSMQLPEAESRWDGVLELKEYVDGAVDVLEASNSLTEGILKFLNHGKELEGAVSSGLDIADTAIQGFHAVVAVVGAVSNFLSLRRLRQAEEKSELEFGRDSGVFSERHTHAVRRGLASTCRLFDSLRVPLETMINAPLTRIAMSDAKLAALKATNPKMERPDFSVALGLDNLLKLSGPAKRRISVTMATRFCSIFQPMLARIEELFAKQGECAQELQSTDNNQPLKQLTGATDVSATAHIRSTSKDLLGLKAVPALAGVDLTYPRVETCLKDDIYDIQIAKDSDVASSLGHLGYEPMKDIEASWVANGDDYVVFGADLNPVMEAPTKPADQLKSEAKRMARVFTLTCEQLHKKGAAICGSVSGASSKQCLYYQALRFPVTDVTFAYRYDDELDDKSAQLKLQKAGYQMLELNEGNTVADLANNLLTDFKKVANPPTPLTKKMCEENDVRRGSSTAAKAIVTMHILRGGMTPLTDIRLAPFVSKPKKGNAGSLETTFWMQNTAYSKAHSTPYTLPTRPYPVATPLPSPMAQATGSITDKALSLVVPPTCIDPTDTTVFIDEKWMKKDLWQMVRGKEGTETKEVIIKHVFDSRCTLGADKSMWERVAASPYPDYSRAEVRTQKPYLWVKRRYALPKFGENPENKVAACPWECSDSLKGIVMPPASIYASQSALEKLRTTFKMDAEFEMKAD